MCLPLICYKQIELSLAETGVWLWTKSELIAVKWTEQSWLMCLWMWQPSRLNPSALLHCETYLESPSGLKLSSMLGCHKTALCHRLTGWIGSPEGKPCLSPRCLIQFHKSQRASKLSRQYSKYVSLIRLQQQWKRWFSALGSSVMRCLSNSNHNPACD